MNATTCQTCGADLLCIGTYAGASQFRCSERCRYDVFVDLPTVAEPPTKRETVPLRDGIRENNDMD